MQLESLLAINAKHGQNSPKLLKYYETVFNCETSLQIVTFVKAGQ